jgi:hypothetical protein
MYRVSYCSIVFREGSREEFFVQIEFPVLIQDLPCKARQQKCQRIAWWVPLHYIDR